MNTITHSQRYLPHELHTKFHAVKLYRTGVGVAFVCRRYKISKASLLRLHSLCFNLDQNQVAIQEIRYCLHLSQ